MSSSLLQELEESPSLGFDHGHPTTEEMTSTEQNDAIRQLLHSVEPLPQEPADTSHQFLQQVQPSQYQHHSTDPSVSIPQTINQQSQSSNTHQSLPQHENVMQYNTTQAQIIGLMQQPAILHQSQAACTAAQQNVAQQQMLQQRHLGQQGVGQQHQQLILQQKNMNHQNGAIHNALGQQNMQQQMQQQNLSQQNMQQQMQQQNLSQQNAQQQMQQLQNMTPPTRDQQHIQPVQQSQHQMLQDKVCQVTAAIQNAQQQHKMLQQQNLGQQNLQQQQMLQQQNLGQLNVHHHQQQQMLQQQNLGPQNLVQPSQMQQQVQHHNLQEQLQHQNLHPQQQQLQQQHTSQEDCLAGFTHGPDVHAASSQLSQHASMQSPVPREIDGLDEVLLLPEDGSQGQQSGPGGNAQAVTSAQSGQNPGNNVPSSTQPTSTNPKCCECKRKSKCLQCKCVKSGGCNGTCLPRTCQFKPGMEPAQTPKAPKAPKAPRAPRTPKTPGAPKAPRAPRTPKTPGAPKTPKTPKANSKAKGKAKGLNSPDCTSSIGSPEGQTFSPLSNPADVGVSQGNDNNVNSPASSGMGVSSPRPGQTSCTAAIATAECTLSQPERKPPIQGVLPRPGSAGATTHSTVMSPSQMQAGINRLRNILTPPGTPAKDVYSNPIHHQSPQGITYKTYVMTRPQGTPGTGQAHLNTQPKPVVSVSATPRLLTAAVTNSPSRTVQFLRSQQLHEHLQQKKEQLPHRLGFPQSGMCLSSDVVMQAHQDDQQRAAPALHHQLITSGNDTSVSDVLTSQEQQQSLLYTGGGGSVQQKPQSLLGVTSIGGDIHHPQGVSQSVGVQQTMVRDSVVTTRIRNPAPTNTNSVVSLQNTQQQQQAFMLGNMIILPAGSSPQRSVMTTANQIKQPPKQLQHELSQSCVVQQATVTSSSALLEESPSELDVTSSSMPDSTEATTLVGQLKSENMNLVEGMEYQLDYPNGTRVITIWDGKHFKLKSTVPPEDLGQVRGGGGGSRQVPQPRALKRGTARVNMLNQHKGSPVRMEMVLQPGSATLPGGRRWIHSSVGKEQLSRRPLHPDKDADQMAGENNPEVHNVQQVDPEIAFKLKTAEVAKKRPLKPTEDGKYAVCDNCGQVSPDYNVCVRCQKPMPDQPKYYFPENSKKVAKVDRTVAQTVSTPASPANMIIYQLDKKKFYGDKPAQSLALYSEDSTNKVVYTYQGRKILAIPKNSATGKKVVRATAANIMRGGKRQRKPRPEPETVTILSSDDEGPGGAAVSPTAMGPGEQDMEVDQSPNGASNEGSPSSTPTSPLALQQPNRRQKMEDSSGNIVLPSRIQHTAAVQRNAAATVASSVLTVQVSARSCRVGSLKGTPLEDVVISTTGIVMNILAENEALQVMVNAEEIIKVMTHFSMNMPVMFIFTTPECAARIRNRCRMVTKMGPYYDPASKEESHKRITLLVNKFTQEVMDKLRKIFYQIQLAHPTVSTGILLMEIDNEMANQILVKSTPHLGAVMDQLAMVPGHGHPEIGDHDDWDEDEEPCDRSRSPSPPRPMFEGPITKLLTYPPPPATGGIAITNEDLFCLNEGEFLNDVIIDFYLKYLIIKVLSAEEKACTHIFSSFFYRRLTQRAKRNDEDLSLSLQQRRHQRVRTWTRHVDLFQKNFVIVPINESAHWYLAVICFPGLREPVVTPETENTNGEEAGEKSVSQTSEGSSQSNGSDQCADTQSCSPTSPANSTSPSQVTKASEMDVGQASPADKENTEETLDSETSETKAKATPAAKKPGILMKQPCILIFDSLAGPTRGGVIRTLRDYLQVEWDVRKKEKEGARVYDKDTIKGGNPKCPQQTNFSDCGIFVLQYVETFFEKPIRDYSIPMKALADWFPYERVRGKRGELKELILNLMRKHNPSIDFNPGKDLCT